MNKKKRIIKFLLCLILFFQVALTGCNYGRQIEMKQDFMEAYSNSNDFFEYCGDSNSYILELEMLHSKIQIYLEKVNGHWEGTLSLYYDKELTESIPIAVVENSIRIYSSTTEKTIGLDSLLLYHFDARQSQIKSIDTALFQGNISEIVAGYSTEQMQVYMQQFYNTFISEFASFSDKKSYDMAIKHFQDAVFSKQYVGKSSKPYYSIRLGFGGDDSDSWQPNVPYFQSVCLMLTERTPYGW